MPALLAHEARHATQYACCAGLPMLPLYFLAAGVSWGLTGDFGARNIFERRAGLADGGYTDRPLRPGVARLGGRLAGAGGRLARAAAAGLPGAAGLRRVPRRNLSAAGVTTGGVPPCPGFTALKVLRRLPHPDRAFTQGLVTAGGTVWESTGRYGQSALRRYQLGQDQAPDTAALPPELFAEGICLVGDAYLAAHLAGAGRAALGRAQPDAAGDDLLQP